MSKEVSSFFTGFFIGALVGGAAALLFARQSGEETRTQVREKGIELKERAEATYTEALKKLEATTEKIRKRVEELSAKVNEALAPSKEEPLRVSKPTEEPEAIEEASAEALAQARME